MGSKAIANRYLKCIMDPINAPSSHIPDMSCYPTNIFRQEQEFNFTVSAGGVGGFEIPWQNDVKYALEDTATTTDATITGLAAVDFTGNTSIQGIYQRIRLVAAGYLVEFTGTDQNNAGTITCTYTSRGEAAGASLTARQNSRDNETYPAKFGAYGIYRPIDPVDFEYANSTDTTVYATSYVHVSGCSSTATFHVKVVCHWEGIPNNDAHTHASFATISPSDPNAMAGVISSVSNVNSHYTATDGAHSTRQATRRALAGKIYIQLKLIEI